MQEKTSNTCVTLATELTMATRETTVADSNR